MKVLVSGAGGFLGRYVVNRLLERGHIPRAIIRPESPAPTWPRGVEIFRADLRVSNNLLPAFDGIDAIIHLAAATSGNEDTQFASTVVGTERFLDAMGQSSVKRLVHVSSLFVYDWGRAKKVMDEDTPLVASLYEMGPYAIAKTWQERIISRFAQSHSLDLTIMRPGFVWGPQYEQIAGMGRHVGPVYLMFGPFTRLPLCHVVNCADCLVTATENHAAIGQAFNLIDGDAVRVWRYVLEYARRTGRSGIFVPIPYRLGFGIARFASFSSAALFGKRGKLPSLLMWRRFESQFKPIRFSDRKVRHVLNWKPIMNFEKCLELYRQAM
jgi:nucleoside-diphosphate-sugar epimerase